MAKFSDIEIFEGLQKSDSKIMSYVWDLYATRIQYFAENLIRNKEEAQDIVSIVFMNLPKASTRFTSYEHIKAWLYISTKHRCIDYMRRRQSQQQQQSHYESHVSETAADEEIATEQMFVKTELMHAIYKEMQKLPENCRKIFQMTYFDGLNAREISDKLRIAVSTVTTQRSRAIKYLKEVLSHKEIITLLILNSIP